MKDVKDETLIGWFWRVKRGGNVKDRSWIEQRKRVRGK
jgi:hypothetical protein